MKINKVQIKRNKFQSALSEQKQVDLIELFSY